MKFDTRDKKPKVWNILILSVITAILEAVFYFVDFGVDKGVLISLTSVIYLGLVIAMLLIAFVEQLKYNPYSYNTIYYVGFAIYLTSVLITNVDMSIKIMKYPDNLSVADLFKEVAGSAANYMYLTLPFVLIFSIALLVSNIALIRHEGRRFVNTLGIILAFALLFGEALLFVLRYAMLEDALANIFTSVYLYFESMLIGTIIANIIVVEYKPEYDKDFIIILGCALRKDGTPRPILRSRIDKALEFRDRQIEETGKKPIFITSGGQGDDEVIPESTSMKRYLIEHGVPENEIIEENRSTNTLENMKFSKEKIMDAGGPGKILFVTTNYHVFRSGTYARLAKMRAVGLGSPTKWYYWPNAAVREFVSILTEHRLKQVAIFGGMIAVNTLIIILTYLA